MSGESVGLLRIAAAVAPTVLPGPLGEAAAAWLVAEAECHEAVPEVEESAGRVLSSIAEEISGEEVEVDFSVTVSTLDKAVGFAREVLALAEQKPASSDDIRDVLAYVSRGRRYVDVEPYPDFQARRALGALMDQEEK